jgi:hypothetical protein
VKNYIYFKMRWSLCRVHCGASEGGEGREETREEPHRENKEKEGKNRKGKEKEK